MILAWNPTVPEWVGYLTPLPALLFLAYFVWSGRG